MKIANWFATEPCGESEIRRPAQRPGSEWAQWSPRQSLSIVAPATRVRGTAVPGTKVPGYSHSVATRRAAEPRGMCKQQIRWVETRSFSGAARMEQIGWSK